MAHVLILHLLEGFLHTSWIEMLHLRFIEVPNLSQHLTRYLERVTIATDMLRKVHLTMCRLGDSTQWSTQGVTPLYSGGRM